MVVIEGLERRVSRLGGATPKVEKRPEVTMVFLPDKADRDWPHRPTWTALLRAALRHDGVALGRVLARAADRGLPSVLRLAHRLAGPKGAMKLAAILQPYAVDIASTQAAHLGDLRSWRAMRRRNRERLPVLVAEPVLEPALLPALPETRLLLPAPDGERNSVGENPPEPEPDLPPGWRMVGGPRPQPRPWADPRAGTRLKVPGFFDLTE